MSDWIGGGEEGGGDASAFAEWVFEAFHEHLELDKIEGAKPYRRFITSVSDGPFYFSEVNRVQCAQVVKFDHPMRRAGYAIGSFSVRVNVEDESKSGRRRPKPRDVETIYALAYWPHGETVPEYVCVSPALESKHGEYRRNFMWRGMLDSLYEKLDTEISRTEEGILRLIGEKALEIDVLFYPETEAEELSGAVEDDRLAIRLLAASILIYSFESTIWGIQSHTVHKYKEVFEALVEDVRPTISLELDEVLKQKFVARTTCGQKITPLTMREATLAGDINFAPWREVWVAERATDLVINGLVHGLPIANNWSYLGGIGRDLFENRSMLLKYKKGLKAEAVVLSLREARERVKEVEERVREAGEREDYHTGHLDEHIFESIEYAQNYLIMSDLGICSTSEFLGITVQSAVDWVRHPPQRPFLIHMYETPDMTARYLFDVCYTAHILHTKGGIIHSDLHLNNITIDERYTPTAAPSPRAVPVVAFVAGPRGAADTYVFPHEGLHYCIIDFSRAILGGGAKKDIAREFGDAYAETFFRAQAERALRVLRAHLPGFVEENKVNIRGFLLAEPEIVFRVMTAVDFLAVGRSFQRHYAEVGKYLRVSPEAVKRAAKLEKWAIEHLIIHLTDLVRGGRPDVGMAGFTALPAVFGDYAYDAWVGRADGGAASEGASYDVEAVAAGGCLPAPRDAVLSAVYSAEAPLRYSLRDYESFPPWMRIDRIIPHLGGFPLTEITGRDPADFLEETTHPHTEDAALAVLIERARRKIADEPNPGVSSWG